MNEQILRTFVFSCHQPLRCDRIVSLAGSVFQFVDPYGATTESLYRRRKSVLDKLIDVRWDLWSTI